MPYKDPEQRRRAVRIVVAATGLVLVAGCASLPKGGSAASTIPSAQPAAPHLDTACTLGYTLGSDNHFIAAGTAAWWLIAVWNPNAPAPGRPGLVGAFVYSTFQGTVSQMNTQYQASGGTSYNQWAGPFATEADAQQSESAITSGDAPDAPGGSSFSAAPAIQVTATNQTSVMVPADSVAVGLYDGYGDLLATTWVGLNLEAIAAGVTVTVASINIEAPGAVSCKTT